MENLRNRIDVKPINKKDNLKCLSKPSYMLQIMIDNNLVAICKSKLALKLNKPAYIGMCILEWSEILMYEFGSPSLNINFYSSLFFSIYVSIANQMLIISLQKLEDIYF